MPQKEGSRSLESHQGETKRAGENLRHAFPATRDGTFASFLLLLEDLEAVHSTVEPRLRRAG